MDTRRKILMINEALGHQNNIDSLVKAGIDVEGAVIHSVHEDHTEWLGPTVKRWANSFQGVLVPLSGRPCPFGYCGCGYRDNRDWFADLMGLNQTEFLMECFDSGHFSGLKIAQVIHDCYPPLPVFLIMDIFPAPPDSRSVLCDAARKVGAIPVPPVMELPEMIRVMKAKWQSMDEIAAAIFQPDPDQA